MTNGKRDYKRELNWEHTKKKSRVKDRAQRNAARATVAKKNGVKGEWEEVKEYKGKDDGMQT